MRKPTGYWNYETCYEEAKKYKARAEFKKNSPIAYAKAHKNWWFSDYVWIEPSKSSEKWDYDSCYNEAKKYESSSEFQKKCKNAWKKAYKKGWLNDYIWFKRPKNKTFKYTEEVCRKEALKYKTLKEFRKSSKDYYQASITYGYLESFDWLKRKRVKKGFWNYERCYKEAKKYKSKSEFEDNCSMACSVARKNGWIEDYDWFINPHIKWTYESCYEEAKKYKTRTEFHDKSQSAYQVACKNKWIEEYTWLERKHKPNGYWTYENCFNEALKYKSRGELCKKNETVSRIARKNGWIDDYDWLKDERFDLINDKIDCVYVYEFIEQNAAYIGRTLMKLKKRRDTDHMFSDKDTVHIFAKENNIPIPIPKYIEENLTIKEGRDRECFWIDEYKKLGWNVLNKAKGGSIGRIGHRFSKYTYETCYELAKNCTSRKDFEKFNQSAYQVAAKNKWIDDYDWFIRKSKPSGYWNYEHCYEEAKKYTNLTEFKKNNSSAYNQARKNNWIEDYDWIERKIVKSGYWKNYSNCYNEAKKYYRITDFIKNAPGAYKQANKNGWLKDYTWFNKNN